MQCFYESLEFLFASFISHLHLGTFDMRLLKLSLVKEVCTQHILCKVVLVSMTDTSGSVTPSSLMARPAPPGTTPPRLTPTSATCITSAMTGV